MRQHRLHPTKTTPAYRQPQTATPTKSPPNPLLQLQSVIGNRATHQLIVSQRQGCQSDATAQPPIQTKPMFRGLSQELTGDRQQLGEQLLPISSGKPMPEAVQEKMEAAFGTEFSDVRIHQGSQADSIGALAYTQGNHIHFQPSQYNPTTQRGQQLLGHELAHVVQQRMGRVAVPQGQSLPINTDSALEAQADNLGAKAARGESAQLGINRAVVSPMQMSITPIQGVIPGAARTGKDAIKEPQNWSGTKSPFSWGRAIANVRHPLKARQVRQDASDWKAKAESAKNWASEHLKAVLEAASFSPDPLVTSQAISDRFPKGPLLNDNEFAAIEALSETEEGKTWLSAAGMYNLNQAVEYLQQHNYRYWLKLDAANRVWLAYLAWRRPERLNITEEEVVDTPAYRLGRSMDAKDKLIDAEQREGYKQQIDEDIQREWINTFNVSKLEEFLPVTEVEQYKNATDILKKVLLILHAGLQVYDKERREHVDYQGAVVRVLSHGGRVNIRIPALQNNQENAYALTDWLGITEDGKLNEGGPVFKRPFGTHHMAIGTNKQGEPGTGTFREQGGLIASIKNLGNTKLYGMNLAVGGIGNRDFNGDVILPDGAHGHMFIGLRPPTSQKDGALEIGIETTAPGAPSTVGYHHGPESSEATANPESSFGGLKADKVGHGSPAKDKFFSKRSDVSSESTNARLVELSNVNGGRWLKHLEELEQVFNEALKQPEYEAYRQLVASKKMLEDWKKLGTSKN